MNNKYHGQVIKVNEIFNDEGIEEIQRRVDSFQHMCDYPHKYTWKDKREFYNVPKHKNAWC